MPYKSRSKPAELITLELLNSRMKLTVKEKRHYLNLKKGYEGEKRFDSLTEQLQCECLIVNDLLLEVNNTTFQIDTLIITRGMINFFEVKNHEGDYYYESDKLFKKPHLEIINPLHQLSRCEALIRQLLLGLGYDDFPMDASVLFINPEFTLYQAPLDKPFIFHSQLHRYMNQLNALPSKLSKYDKKLADQLVALHITDSPFGRLPSYDYGQLRKGIVCPKCHSLAMRIHKRKCVCRQCDFIEPSADAILRSIKEYKILFPNNKITTNTIHDWCRVVPSKKIIRSVLASHFRAVGVRQWTYYV
ncbi:NERD domain-containing protein [Lentibacillus lipolyticus]|nr:NERD domain-containing protein [Lentibacillus lipolyticus]